MKSYLLPGLDEARRQILTDAGVQFYTWGAGGIIIDGDEKLELALRALRVIASETPTQYANLFQLKLTVPGQVSERTLTAEQIDARSKSRASYIKVCSSRLQGLFSAAEQRLAEARKVLPSLEGEFASLCRQEFLAGNPVDEEQSRVSLREELKRLRAVPKVLNVQCVTGGLLVFTDILCTRNPANNATYEIGKFMLSISLDGSGGIRMFNASRRLDGFRKQMNAPNVYSSGEPCLDEVQQTLLELVARFELAAVADIAIQFIEAAGEDDFLGKFVGNWPAAALVSTQQGAICASQSSEGSSR